MKNRIFANVRMIERKKRGISPTKSQRRGRSDDSESDTDGGSQKSLKFSGLRPVAKS